MTIADHIGLGLGLGLVTALGGPDLRNGGPSEWRTQILQLAGLGNSLNFSMQGGSGADLCCNLWRGSGALCKI